MRHGSGTPPPAESSIEHYRDSSLTPPSSHKSPKVLHTAYISLSILLLFLNYFLAQYDKFVLSYFRSQVTNSLQLSETQYGLISGYATGIVYALLALPIAFIADYTSARVWTLTIAAVWWSLCVVFQGLAHNFTQIFCARVGMGIGQAAVEALSISLISDLVKQRSIFVGNSVFYVGVYIGEAVSGQIAAAFTRTGTSWQIAMRAIGIAGVVIAFVLRLVLREPNRRHSLVDHGTTHPGVRQASGKQRGDGLTLAKADFVATVEHLLHMHSFWLLVLGASVRQLAGNIFGYYMPGYLSALYPDTPDILSRYGIIVGVVGSVTVLSGGLVTSLFWNKTKLTPIYLTSIGGMISSLFVLLMIFSRQLSGGNEVTGVRIVYATLFLAYLTAELWLGSFFALIALLLPPGYKTFGLAIWSSVQVLIYSSGPEIMGLVLRKQDTESEGYLIATRDCLAVIIVLGYWVSGIILLSAIPLVRRDLAGKPASRGKRQRYSFLGFGLLLACLVIIIFTLSLVYKA